MRRVAALRMKPGEEIPGRCKVKKVEMFIEYFRLVEADVSIGQILKNFECSDKEFETAPVGKELSR